MININTYIIEKLHLDKNTIKDNYFLIVYSNYTDGKLCVEIFNDVVEAQKLCTGKGINFLDGFVSDNLSTLEELKPIVEKNPPYKVIKEFAEKHNLISYIKYIQKPEINDILKKD